MMDRDMAVVMKGDCVRNAGFPPKRWCPSALLAGAPVLEA